MTLRALIWDVDGTLAETERDGHRRAFNAAFAELGLPWSWTVERYGELLTTAGGYERLLRDLAVREDAPPAGPQREALARELHRRKNQHYAWLVRQGRIALRGGVRELMDEARAAGLLQAIATTTSRANVDALLSAQLGPRWQAAFDCIACAEDAPLKKPHPQVYELALQRLGLAPHEALAIEDSPNGIQAAQAAGVPVLVTASVYFAGAAAARGPGIVAAGAGLDRVDGWTRDEVINTSHESPAAGGRIGLAVLQRWHATPALQERGGVGRGVGTPAAVMQAR